MFEFIDPLPRSKNDVCQIYGLPQWPQLHAADRRSQEYRYGAMQGAELDKQAIRIGCHRTRTYTMKDQVLEQWYAEEDVQHCIPN